MTLLTIEAGHRMRDLGELGPALKTAIATDAFEVHYQPLMNVDGGLSGFEALLRWNDPERGQISPAVFIPIAEATGDIKEIGAWVLWRACTDCAGWGSDLKVAINLSAMQIDDALVDAVKAVLATSGLAPSRLELEVTETVLMPTNAGTLDTLHRLRQLGIHIALDDFGTGFASLTYLSAFPFDRLKIDRSFVSGVNTRYDCLAIVRASIGLGRALGMEVTAEGVETDAQRNLLIAEGCSQLQGYLFGRPAPVSTIEDVLDRFGDARTIDAWEADDGEAEVPHPGNRMIADMPVALPA